MRRSSMFAAILFVLAGGQVVSADPETKRMLDVWEPVGPALPWMHKLKRSFDPAGILNPGRYAGGL